MLNITQFLQSSNTTEDCYPAHCTGWMYATTPLTARRLVKAAQMSKKMFWIDDVWVTGFLAEDLQIEHKDVATFFTMSTEELLLQKVLQNQAKQMKDFLAGPMNRDFQISKVLAEKAKWCYAKKCYNEIYHPSQ